MYIYRVHHEFRQVSLFCWAFLFFVGSPFLAFSQETIPEQSEEIIASTNISPESMEHYRVLFQMAENAFQSQDYPQAAASYGELLDSLPENFLDENAKADLQIRLASSWAQSGQLKEAEALLEGLAEQSLPAHLVLRRVQVLAKLLTARESFREAYEVLQELDHYIASYEWRPEDRSLLLQLKEKLDHLYESTILDAERAFEMGLYGEAIPLYQDVLGAIRSRAYPEALKEGSDIFVKIRYRLAQAYYMEGAYPAVIATLRNQSAKDYQSDPSLVEIYKNSTYLLALAHRNLDQFDSAIQQLQKYLAQGNRNHLRHYDEARWELGYCSYQLGRYTTARRYLTALEPSQESPLFALRELYLARIELRNHLYKEMTHRLIDLEPKLASTDYRRFELHYLLGEAYFQTGDYGRAIDSFTQAIPPRNKRNAAWYPNTLLNLGWSYLRLADHSQKSVEIQKKYFAEAEKSFTRLLTLRQEEDVYLALGKTYLRMGQCLQDSNALNKVESLLSGEGLFSSLEGASNALYLRAEATSSPAKKLELLKELTNPIYQETTLWSKSWFSLGVNHLKLGKQAKVDKESEEAFSHFQQAIQSFQTSYEESVSELPSFAALSLKYKAECLFELGTKESLQEGLSVCETLFHKEPHLVKVLAEPDEVLFLKALIASQLSKHSHSQELEELAIEALKQVCHAYSKGRFADRSYQMLGTLLYHQGNYKESEMAFLSLAKTYPESAFAGEAWFWASECATHIGGDPETIRSYRKEVFENYPHSAHAAEAYFNFFSYSEYLQGGSSTTQHLKEMKKRYPNSPLNIGAQYLLGLECKRTLTNADEELTKEKGLTQACIHMETAAKLFKELYSKGALSESNLEYYVNLRFQSMLEKASLYLEIACESSDARENIYLEYAEKAYRELLEELEDEQNPLAQLLLGGGNPDIYTHQAVYGLARSLFEREKFDLAMDQLAQLLDDSSFEENENHYFVARAWQLRTKIAVASQKYEDALTYAKQAEEVGQNGALSLEDIMELWIYQSECYEALEDPDQVILLLSKVINQTISSHLRVQAMYRRAEAYERQGKHQLALRQYEAVALRSGEWAMKAQEKLDNDYGFY